MDHTKVTAFLGQFVTDLAATEAAGSIAIGYRLGLYRALAQGPATPEQFAERTGCHLRYLTEWLRGQAAGGYADYDAATGEFSLSEEQAFCLADPDGTWLLVEPNADDNVQGNFNPAGRLYYSGSTFLCVPNGLSQPGGYALGAQAGEAATRHVVTDAGFTRFRSATRTAFNLVYEVRP